MTDGPLHPCRIKDALEWLADRDPNFIHDVGMQAVESAEAALKMIQKAQQATRDEAHAFLRVCNQSYHVSSWEPEGIHIPVQRVVTAQEVRQYVLGLERRLLTLSTALADHLEGRPVAPVKSP